MTEAEIPEHVAVFRHLRAVFGDPGARSGDARRRRAGWEETRRPYEPGREPHGIADVVDGFAASMGWESPLARAELLASWPEIVGAETAAHASPVSMEDGVLTVRCDSTAWAQQLRLMRATVAARIAALHAAAGVERVDFIGPDAPSWKRGRRTIPGRGPRDTYG